MSRNALFQEALTTNSLTLMQVNIVYVCVCDQFLYAFTFVKLAALMTESRAQKKKNTSTLSGFFVIGTFWGDFHLNVVGVLVGCDDDDDQFNHHQKPHTHTLPQRSWMRAHTTSSNINTL